MKNTSLLLVCIFAMPSLVFGNIRDELFTIPSVESLPLNVKRLSIVEKDNVIVEELFINGPVFNNQPSRIYAYYARPKSAGTYPGVVQLHGSGLDKLNPDLAIAYAKANYVCISIDWAGPDWKGEGKTRETVHSDYSSLASQAIVHPDPSGDPHRLHYEAVDPAQSSITNGVRFARRAFQFLRSRPEVDSTKLCLSGMSAGAHLALLVLGTEPDIQAAAVKYGSGFIKELNFGGYYGPMSLCSPERADAWLSVLDPKHGLARVKAATLMLSGTDDIFFFMPAVLATWRELPGSKALLMLPNDSHTQVGNEDVARQWFSHVLTGKPEWPILDAAKAVEKAGAIDLSVVVRGDIAKVAFWYKRMPAKTFNFKRGNTPAETVVWQSVPAEKAGDNWTASLPPLVAGEQILAYAMAEDVAGTKASSDTVQVKSTSQQAPPSAPVPAKAAAASARDKTVEEENLFLDPSFEEGPPKKGRSGNLFLNFTGNPTWIEDSQKAHTGVAALQVDDKNGLACGAPAAEGAQYRLSGWFRAEGEEATNARLQINWKREDDSMVKFDIITPKLDAEYQECVLTAEAPPGTTAAILIILGGGTGPSLVDDVYFGLDTK